MDKLELNALGKINLGLDILGRRENGYHEVKMVMQTVYLYDRICIERQKESGIELQTNLKFLPVDRKNLAYRAAEMLTEEFGIREGFRISLEKHIPVTAGLAGGSSDAAAVLYGLNIMCRLKLSEKELMARAAKLGADVPYCIRRGTMLAEGVGEILTPLPPLPKCCVLIAKPPLSISTEAAYKKYDAVENPGHAKIDVLVEALRKGDLREVAGNMGNVLEPVMTSEYPVIADIRDTMLETGALGAMMSGSGPSVFGIYDSRRMAKAAAAVIRRKKLARQVYVTNVHNVRRSDG